MNEAPNETPYRPTEDEWLQHKTRIRQLYIVDELPLKQLIVEVQSLGLFVTKAQLEYKLKRWHFRRNIDQATWTSIGRRITKRKYEGKESQVILCGKRLKLSTIEKETKRYQHRKISSPSTTLPSPLPTSPTNIDLSISTPQPVPMEFSWPSTLPWLIFRSKQFQFMSKPQKSGNEATQVIQPRQAEQCQLLATREVLQTLELKLLEPQTQVSQLAARIGKSMPEAFHGEHLQRSQALLTGSNEDSLYECFTILLYELSNNLVDLCDYDKWNTTMALLEQHNIFNLKLDLTELDDRTISGIIDGLFRAAIYQLVNPRNANTKCPKASIVIKWLLSSNYNPDTFIVIPPIGNFLITAIQAAIRYGKLELMKCLLDAGADAHLTPNHSVICPPLELALKMYRFEMPLVGSMVKLLLEHSGSVSLQEALHLAIMRQDMQLVSHIIQRGGDLSAASKPENGFLYEETALSVAAAVGKEETRHVLDLLKAQYPFQSLSSFLTVDVFISAAAEGKDDTMRFLHDIKPITAKANYYGITPMHAAARMGRLSTCKLLLNLQALYDSSSEFLSPLHLASYGGHQDVVQLFIDSGANVNSTSNIKALGEQDDAIERCGINTNILKASSNFTPLEMLLWHEPATSVPAVTSRCLACAAKLIRAGAYLTGHEVHFAAHNLHIDLLSAALDAGASPDYRLEEVTALQCAMSALFPSHGGIRKATGRAVVTSLLKRGAKVSEGEVFLAALYGDLNLLRLVLSKGGCLFAIDSRGLSPVGAAILSFPITVLRQTFEWQFYQYDSSALCASISAGVPEIVDRLLSLRTLHREADLYEGTAVGLAAKSGNLSLLKKLLAYIPVANVADLPFQSTRWGVMAGPLVWKGAFWFHQVVQGSPLTLAVMGGSVMAVNELLNSGYEPDKFTWATIANQNNLKLAKLLFDDNKRVISCSSLIRLPFHSPLIGSIRHHNKELTLVLLEAGADVNEHNLDLLGSRSPLQLAVELGALEIVECLLEAGADVNAPAAFVGGGTALQLAAIQGHLGLAKQLLELDAEVNALGAAIRGRTALEGAAEHGRLDILELLLQNGVSITGSGRTQYTRAVEFASEEGHHAAANLLRFWH